MTTPPNTELKSAEEWMKELRHESSYGEPAETMEHRIRRIQHNAMLHAAEIATTLTHDDCYIGSRYSIPEKCKQAILTRAEQILKGEK